MQHDYNEVPEDVSGLSDDEMYFRHVIGNDHELQAMDMMLCNALSPTSSDDL